MINNFIFFVGLPCCGKSTYISENYSQYQVITSVDTWEISYSHGTFYKDIIVSADAIKEHLDGYTTEHPENVHEKSVREAKRIIEYFAKYNNEIIDNLILDGGGVNNHYNLDIINFVREANPKCKIKCIYFDTPIEVCLKRMESRERKVPVEDIYNKNLKIVACLERYIPLVDEFEKVSYFTNKHIFLDMDGTIAGYGKVRQDIDGNSDFVSSELFLHLKPVKHVINYIKDNFDMKNVYILTAVANIVAWNEKLIWLEKYFPEVPKENILFVGNKDYKHVFIKHWAVKNNWKLNDITLVDDLHTTIDKCKKLGINCVHPSNVEALTDKYTFLA